MRISRLAFLALAGLIASCERSTTSPDDAVAVDGSFSVVGCEVMQSTNYIQNPWPDELTCGHTHYVKVVGSADSAEKAEVSQGTGKLGSILDGSFGLPDLDYNASASNPLIEVTFNGSSSDTLYTGAGTKSGGITITRTNDPGGGGPFEGLGVPVTELDRVILHELVQIIGFKEKNDQGGFPALDDCAIEVDTEHNQDLCAHEIQSIYHAFGLRDGHDVDLTSEMTEFLFISPSSKTLEVDESQAFAPNPLPSSGVNWDLSNGENAVVVTQLSSSQITLKGNSEGSASLTATAKPSNSVVWDGDWLSTVEPASITVTSPPAPPVVTTVTLTPAFVTLSSSNTSALLTATAKDQHGDPMPGVSFNWSKSSGWIFLSGTGNTRTVTGCRDGPLPLMATVTATATGTSVSDNTSVTVMKNYPYYC